MKLFAVCVLFAGAVLAQMMPNPGPGMPVIGVPPQLQAYLELAPDQVVAIARQNGALARFQAEKYRRAAEVQRELREEMARQNLDPMAIGLRYVELEAIEREIRAEREKTIAEIQKVLTAAQKTKLRTLEDALRSYPTACEAANFNLMPLPVVPQQIVQNVTGLPVATFLQPPCGGGVLTRMVLPATGQTN